MRLNLYQVDAFADKLFTGNPAAIIPLDNWIDDELMQNIAMENNLAETAYFVKNGDRFDIRWFTPELEINLCGHATLASAYVLYNFLGYTLPTIRFESKSGPLLVNREAEMLYLDFPSWNPERLSIFPDVLTKGLGKVEVNGVYKNRDYLVELNNEEDVKNCKPDFSLLKKVDGMVIITAPGKDVDFVSRFFAPTAGIDEDPVTGSAHSQLIPFWNYKLGKNKMVAKQLSRRGGTLFCEQKGERVVMGGKCAFYMKGEVEVDN
jgi:predicted PhzF superfamily epimerase YddE/YHI9